MTNSICGVQDCKREGKKRGWCAMHYERWLRHGDPAYRKRLVMVGHSEVERFWPRVQKTESCWLWTGAIQSAGYGRFVDDGKRHVLAHRFSYELHCGPIEDGMFVLHSCDVRRCVNPAHLRQGDASDNMADIMKRGRHYSQKVKR